MTSAVTNARPASVSEETCLNLATCHRTAVTDIAAERQPQHSTIKGIMQPLEWQNLIKPFAN